MIATLNKWKDNLMRLQGFFMGSMVTAILLIPVMLWAQEAVAPATDGAGFKGQIMALLFGTLLLGAGIISKMVLKLLADGTGSLKDFIKSKVKNEFVETALLRLTGLAHTVAANTFMTSYKATRIELKKAVADGKIDKAELVKAREAAKKGAIETLKAITPVDILKTILGGKAGDPNAENQLLGVLIEGAVYGMKAEGAAIKATATVVKEVVATGTASPKVS